jgi:hypothetical protein
VAAGHPTHAGNRPRQIRRDTCGSCAPLQPRGARDARGAEPPARSRARARARGALQVPDKYTVEFLNRDPRAPPTHWGMLSDLLSVGDSRALKGDRSRSLADSLSAAGADFL